jgi:penicillin-binding protein 1C
LIFILIDLIFPFKPNINYSQIVLSKDGKILTSFLSSDEKWRFKSTLSQNSDFLKKSILYKEDKYFYCHPGFNPIAIARSFVNNIINMKIMSGGSTITMQLARMMEPKSRNYLNKFIELFRALQLEFHYSKDEIFEMYLNKIPFGSNIEGTYSASVMFLNRYPDKLSLSQAVALTVIPNNPISLSIGKNNRKIESVRNKWLKRMLDDNIFDKSLIDNALRERFTALRFDSPKKAPQLCIRLRNLAPDKAIIESTIDFQKQSICESICNQYVNTIKQYGINNAAVIVINNINKNVECYVGSNDFFDNLSNGQIDGVKSVRSPGSTLKPLLYSLSIDEGLITPKMILLDVPIINNSYNPENFDGKFRGKVTAEFALAHSLNVPAVKLLAKLGTEKFINILDKCDFTSIQANKKTLGLSMILGGCGVTLEQLSNMYSMLANSGVYSPLIYLKNEKIRNQQRFLSQESSYMISEILTKLYRPDLPNSYRSARGIPLIAWKTGTSQGRRDAWAIGYNGSHTIGVWTGNFTGSSNPMLAGADIAVPLLFELFHSLPETEKQSWLKTPPNLMMRNVDAETGLLPSEFTTSLVSDYFIPGKSPNTFSNIYEEIWVSKDEKISYCDDCLPIGNVKQKIYEKYPPELVAYFDEYQIKYNQIPPHNKKCTSFKTGEAPIIVSPVSKNEYIIEKNSGTKIALECKATNDIHQVYWYIDNQYFGTCKVNEKLFFEPKEKGKYKISCSDDKGHNSNVYVNISFY